MDHAVGTQCRADALTFRLNDPDRRLAGVRLLQEIGMPRDRIDFAYDGVERAWRLSLPRPAAWRLEYLLEQRYADGRIERICDPDNPHRVETAFGAKSVLECPEYIEPAWLHLPPAAGSWRELTIPAPPLGTEVRARVWSPATHTDRVVVAHDGPEYDRLARLGHYSAGASPTRTSTPTGTPTSAPPICGTSTRWSTTGCARRSSTRCCVTRCATRTRPTSTSGSPHTSGACSTPGSTTASRRRPDAQHLAVRRLRSCGTVPHATRGHGAARTSGLSLLMIDSRATPSRHGTMEVLRHGPGPDLLFVERLVGRSIDNPSLSAPGTPAG